MGFESKVKKTDLLKELGKEVKKVEMKIESNRDYKFVYKNSLIKTTEKLIAKNPEPDYTYQTALNMISNQSLELSNEQTSYYDIIKNGLSSKSTQEIENIAKNL